jgi:ACGX-repeat protein
MTFTEPHNTLTKNPSRNTPSYKNSYYLCIRKIGRWHVSPSSYCTTKYIISMKRSNEWAFGHSAQHILNAEAENPGTACGSACGAGDKEEKPSACGSACGAGDK